MASAATIKDIGQATLDPLYMARSLLRRRKYEECAELCTQMLLHDQYDRAAWFVKVRALTEPVAVDETELDEEGMAPRPGTSFKKPLTSAAAGGASQAIRPMTKSGRPVSGYLRPGTQSTRPMTMDAALKTARSGTAARPLTNATGRSVRLGTASMLQDDATTFINPARLDLTKYASRPALAKALFRYLFHVANDTLLALDLAIAAAEACSDSDWWWLAMAGICQYRLGMLREAKQHFEASLELQSMVFTTHLLANVYIRLDQPINAIECYKEALSKFPDDTSLHGAMARVHEGVGDMAKSVARFKLVLKSDSTDPEAIASLAADYFYSDRPETALLLYRRLLQMGISAPELFNNLGLSCFYAQQYDMALGCFERALQQADDETMGDVWYNVSHIAINLGDVVFAVQCCKLAVTCCPTHAEAYSNLGALEHRQGHATQARAHYISATKHGEHLYEPHYNLAVLDKAKGDMEGCFQAATKAQALFPDHRPSQKLIQQLKDLFSVV